MALFSTKPPTSTASKGLKPDAATINPLAYLRRGSFSWIRAVHLQDLDPSQARPRVRGVRVPLLPSLLHPEAADLPSVLHRPQTIAWCHHLELTCGAFFEENAIGPEHLRDLDHAILKEIGVHSRRARVDDPGRRACRRSRSSRPSMPPHHPPFAGTPAATRAPR